MNTDIAILEFRAGPGGEEAKNWAADLMRMYTRYAGILAWKVEQLDDFVIRIRGTQAFTKLQYEAGTHRVQRTPSTERHGRIHTSTATIAVLPEIPENEVYIPKILNGISTGQEAKAGKTSIKSAPLSASAIHHPESSSSAKQSATSTRTAKWPFLCCGPACGRRNLWNKNLP